MASTEHLLAMKVLAARRSDAPDIATLVERLGLTSATEVTGVVATVFADETVPARAYAILAELFPEPGA